MDKNLLKSKITLYGETQGDLAQTLNMSQQRLSMKINNKDAEFSQSEITAIIKRYNLSAEEVMKIFFSL